MSSLWWWATRTDRLLYPDVDYARARATRGRFALGLVVYPFTVVLALISAPLTLAVHGVLAATTRSIKSPSLAPVHVRPSRRRFAHRTERAVS